MRFLLFALALLPVAVPVHGPAADPLGLVLPTENDAIFSDDPSQFYMYTNRTFEGVSSQPWSGGTYGYSRNKRRTDIGIVYTRFHEGIDIRPVRRDESGEPLDDVRSIADGTVVYVNATPSRSNYGRYIVVHHDWGHGPFFSLYAHLARPYVEAGQRVRAGTPLARMGYTGAGLDRTRAHVHVELAMILSDRFQRWYEHHFTSENHHGIFNGFNLIGIDIAALFQAHRRRPSLSIPEFLARHEEVHYRVAVPAHGNMDFFRRYPWVLRDADRVSRPTSWEFAFAATGVPLEVRPGNRQLSYPTVTWVKEAGTDHAHLTSGKISGTGDSVQLTPRGSRFVQLISDSF